MEADVDHRQTFPDTLSRDPLEPSCGARWRQCAAAVQGREHVDLPPDDPPPTLADAPQRPLRDAELWLLARRTHGAALHVDFELRTSLVRQMFRRDFVYVSRLLHSLEASRRVQGLDRANLDDALASLQRREEDVHELLDRILADLAARIAAQAEAQGESSITFVRPARFQATVVCPFARRHLGLLMHADEALANLERAWLMGAVDPPTRTALTSECRRALHGYKDLACDRRAAVGEEVRKLNARRRQDARRTHDG